jgi:hypothetical protein
VVGYVWRLCGIHIDIVRDRGSKGMDRCPLTVDFWKVVGLSGLEVVSFRYGP